MKRVRTPCLARSGSSRSIVSPKISINASTSSVGRDQFSVEKAYTASETTPSSIAASTVRRRARVPSRWPSATGRPRRSAQRPLPSMMIATLRARLVGLRSVATSNLHDLGLFMPDQLVDRAHVLVSELLHLGLPTPLLVVADFAVLDQLLEVLQDVAADVSNRDFSVLAVTTDELDELLAAFLGQLGDRETDDLAVVRGREAEVGLHHRLLDRLDLGRVEGLHG